MQRLGGSTGIDDDRIGGGSNQLLGAGTRVIELTVESNIDAQVATFDPAQVLEPLAQRGRLGLRCPVLLSAIDEHADAAHPFRRPCGRRERGGEDPAQQRQARAPADVPWLIGFLSRRGLALHRIRDTYVVATVVADSKALFVILHHRLRARSRHPGVGTRAANSLTLPASGKR